MTFTATIDQRRALEGLAYWPQNKPTPESDSPPVLTRSAGLMKPSA